MNRRLLSALLLATAALNAAAQRVSLEVSLSPASSPNAAAALSRFAAPNGLPAGLLPLPPLIPSSPLLPAPRAAVSAVPFAATLRSPRAAALPAAVPSAKARAAPAPRSAKHARFDGDALFDARRFLHQDDSMSLLLNGYRFDDAAGRLLAPKTGTPLTNKEGRALQNALLEARSRGTLLRLVRETEPDGSQERKAALTDINRDSLPREVRKARKLGPEKERAVILKRLASLYRRWLERAAPQDGFLAPADASAEEKLGGLVAAAAVKRFSNDPEGDRLLNELRGADGALRLPTIRVLRLDARYGALYTPTGRQLVISLDFLKGFLLARVPEAERPEAGKHLATEAGALEYLSKDPARVEALAADVDTILFHELVHFRQDLERPLFTAGKKEEVPPLTALEYEYEAYFRQALYTQSLLSRSSPALDIHGIADYLAFIDDFDAWKGAIDARHKADFLKLEELEKLQDVSQRLLSRLAGPEDRRSAAAAGRLRAAARGKEAIAAEKKAAATRLAEYRERWPALAREGLRRWIEVNEGVGRLSSVVLAQDRMAKLAGSPADTAAWNAKAAETAARASLRLERGDDLSLDERIEWINALSAHYNGLGVSWPKEVWIAMLRDFPQKALQLRAGAGAAGVAQNELLQQAEAFEKVLEANRAHLRGATEALLAAARVNIFPRRRRELLAGASMQAEMLADEALLSAARTLATAPPVEAPKTIDDRPLLERMLERVTLDDRGREDERKALDESFARLLETPTGRHYAEEFLAEGLTAIVHFNDFPDSQLLLVDGRKKFFAAQAYTDWRQDGYAEVRLNRHYVDGDADYMRESLPSIIGHELLGHGLWYGRAEKVELNAAYHVHELNETLARLVGWAIDHELDGRFEDAGAWNYLSDPAHYLVSIKMRLPYYALTYGKDEMADPMAALRSRLAVAEQEVEFARRNLVSQKTWPPVVDHMTREHGIPPERFELLRKELSDLEALHQEEIVNVEAIIRAVSEQVAQFAADAARKMELYLARSAAHPFLERLSAETERLGAALVKTVRTAPHVPPRPPAPRPADQITMVELMRMYRQDIADDSKRKRRHWAKPD